MSFHGTSTSSLHSNSTAACTLHLDLSQIKRADKLLLKGKSREPVSRQNKTDSQLWLEQGVQFQKPRGKLFPRKNIVLNNLVSPDLSFIFDLYCFFNRLEGEDQPQITSIPKTSLFRDLLMPQEKGGTVEDYVESLSHQDLHEKK